MGDNIVDGMSIRSGLRPSAVAGPFLLASAVLAVGAACAPSHDDTPQCVDVSLDCKPIVNPPTFDALYKNIFQPTCATGTVTCHGPAMSGGLDMRTEDSAYAGLSARSNPQSVGCSLLVRRIESTDESFRMPQGPTPLSAPQRCAIEQWIANGAKR